MTAPATSGLAPLAPVAANRARLAAALTQLQHRAVVVGAVRYAIGTVGITVGVAALAVWLRTDVPEWAGRPSMGLPVGLLVTALVGAAAVALVTAWLTRPALPEVARTLDRRLRLDDRLVTALQFTAADDAFAHRVVVDALSHVVRVRAADAYPLRVPRMLWTAALATALVPLALLITTTPSPSTSLGAGSVTGGGGASALATRPGGVRREAREAAGNPTGPAAVVAAGATPEAIRQQDTEASASSPDVRRQAPDAPSVSQAAAPLTPSITSAANRGPAGSAGAGGAGATPVGGAASGAGTRGRDRQGAGGGTMGDQPYADAEPSRAASDAVESRARWAAGERALLRDHIPPGRRESVRRYFAAIRPSELP